MKWAALLLGLLGCGLQPVELAPSPAPQPSNNTNVVGAPSADAIALLAVNAGNLDAGNRLGFVQPNAALAIPENVAPLVFAWRAANMQPGRPAPPTKPNPGPGSPAPPPPMAAKDKPDPPAPSRSSALAYALILRAGDTELLRVYTDASQASFPADRWRDVLANQVGRVLGLELRALFEPGDEVVRLDPLTIEVRGAVPTGAIYAFSTRAEGIVRSNIEQTRSGFLAIAAEAPGQCVGCHAVSRDGRKLFAAVGGGGSLVSRGLSDGAFTTWPWPAPSSGNEDVFGSYDPSGTRIAVSSAGGLYILDASSGVTLSSANWPGQIVRQPDWSPDARFIALSVSVAGDPPGPHGSDIARVSVASDGSLGAPEPLIDPSANKDTSRWYPSYSPDGSVIAFEQRMGPGANPDNGTLWIVASSGGRAVALSQASQHTQPSGADGWPSWMPGDRAERPFLIFASSRAADGGELAPGQRQLFGSALDLTMAAAGQDPSLAAFWLPFQDPSSSYRHAVWASTINSCTPLPEICNGSDDDCDDRVDEACCEPQAETCDDGIDNDCDGVSDEGCGCALRDVCADGLDNDCDGTVDEMVCAPVGPGP